MSLILCVLLPHTHSVNSKFSYNDDGRHDFTIADIFSSYTVYYYNYPCTNNCSYSIIIVQLYINDNYFLLHSA